MTTGEITSKIDIADILHQVYKSVILGFSSSPWMFSKHFLGQIGESAPSFTHLNGSMLPNNDFPGHFRAFAG